MFDNKLAEHLVKNIVNNELTLEDILVFFKEDYIDKTVAIKIFKLYLGELKDVSTNL